MLSFMMLFYVIWWQAYCIIADFSADTATIDVNNSIFVADVSDVADVVTFSALDVFTSVAYVANFSVLTNFNYFCLF